MRIGLVALATLVLLAGTAFAGRKRVVVLEFEGPKADKFHDDLVKLIKKSHTVVPVDKWNGAAEELDAQKVTEKNVKKVAKKLKIDGVVEGKIEKRRDQYIVHLKLRAGTSGEMVGQRIDTKSDGPRLDSGAQHDLKDELMGAIEDLEANHGGGASDDEEDGSSKAAKKKVAAKDKSDDDEDAAPAKKSGFGKKTAKDKADKPDKADDDEDAAPAKKSGFGKKTAKADDDDSSAKSAAAAKKKGAAKADKPDDETTAALSTKHDDDESPLPKGKKRAAKADKSDDDSSTDSKPAKKKKVAKGGDESDDGSADVVAPEQDAIDAWEAISPANRALDITAGASFTGRSLSFNYSSTLAGTQIPPSYHQPYPAPGFLFDGTVYPLAYGHKRHDILTGLGLEIVFDKVLKINSQKLYGPIGMQNVANLSTSETRFAVNAVFRYPVNPKFVVGGKLGYQGLSFTIAQTLPDNTNTDVPNVSYAIIEPTAFVRYTVIPKLVAGVDLSYMLMAGFGAIATEDPGEYGKGTSGSGYEVSGGAEYDLTNRIFARAVVRAESVGMSFPADQNTKANNRSSNPMMQTVFGAKDFYWGGFAVVGFMY